jgi:hypothetical protein
MSRLFRFDRRWLAYPCNAAVVLSLAFAPHLAADAYLDAINMEAHKIDGAGEAPAKTTQDAGSVLQDSRATAFEKKLDQQFHGAFLLYKQLPAGSQADIFDAYEKGTSIEEAREMIMERFLNRR